MRNKNFKVFKNNGNLETFSKKKLYTSLRRSGLTNKTSQMIADKVSHEVGEGSKTRDIFHKTLSLVNKTSPIAAVQYSLKKAIFDLGPSGHHFETFVARYFEELGFETSTCKTMQGKWVKHEVDVIAWKDGKRFFVECKFHNRLGIKNDIKQALYVKARWDDLKDGPEGKNLHGFYFASNTAFSLDAITYAKGSNLHLLGVNCPIEKPFIEEIKNLHLYPVTSLKSLNKHVKAELLSKNIVVAKDLQKHLDLLRRYGLDEEKIDHLLNEINQLVGTN